MDDDQNGRQCTVETRESRGRQRQKQWLSSDSNAQFLPEDSDLQQRLDETQELAGIGDWKYDAATGNFTWSRMISRLLKRSPLSGHMTFDEYLFYYGPDDSKRLLETMEEVILGNERREIALRARLLQGEIVRHHCILVPILDWNGAAIGINGFLKALDETEHTLKRAGSGISKPALVAVGTRDVLFRVTLPDGACEYISPAVCDISGRPPREWHRKPFLIREILHPGWRDRFARKFNYFLAEGGPEDHLFPIVHLSGELRWMHLRATALRDEKGRIFAVEGIASDITARMRRDVERKRLIRQLRKALAGARILRGLLPICSFCKKVRDDQGYWTQIESFLTEHSDLFFTHGLCPECLEVYYPEYRLPRNPTKQESTG
ncbi:MAG: PAS domain S-box protein [Deltaproteobacteria bacterium]|nr:PAS domain S-box protein [Deltaproteobacteria bacterium]